jgi:ABC-type multidrug transport system fused ATPase/permease subunit
LNIKQVIKAIGRLNERVAVWGTKWFGSIVVFYLFFIWGMLGLMPFIPKSFQDIILLVSSAWIQLWALPLLAVGTAVLNRTSEARASQDHETIKSEFEEVKNMHKENSELLRLLNEETDADREMDARIKRIETMLLEQKHQK